MENMSKDKLLIFDLDGTLFRTEPVDVEAVNRALVKNGFEAEIKEEIMELIGEPLDIFIRKLKPLEKEDTYKKLMEDIIDFEVQLIPEYGEMYPNVMETMKKLKKNGNILCICTNGNRRYVETITDKFRLNDCFEDIIYRRSDYDKIKTIDELKKKYPMNINIVIGDRAIDFLAAKENKCIAIGVNYGFGKKEELDMADYIADSIEEVVAIIDGI